MLHEINYKMPIYKSCTLEEILFVSISVLIMLGVTLFLVTKLLFGYGFIGVAITLVALVPLTKYLLGRLQIIKQGKPYGYYRHLFIKKLQHTFLFNVLKFNLYVSREGKWSVRRQ